MRQKPVKEFTVRNVPVFIAVALLVLSARPVPASPVAGKAQSDTLLRRVVVMGASASAGHRTGREIGKYAEDVPLSALVKAMIHSKQAKIIDASDELFFIAPESTGVEMVKKAKEHDPTCVIAIDYLFWFGYGNLASLELRQKRLAKGLKLLEDFECPLLISELPDMHRATTGGKLGKRQVPGPEMLEALNRSIMEWAGPRKNVIVVPLRKKLADLYGDRAVTVGKSSWKPPEALTELLQKDKLHPTITGLGMMAALSLEALLEKKLVSGSELELDAGAAAKAVIRARKKADD